MVRFWWPLSVSGYEWCRDRAYKEGFLFLKAKGPWSFREYPLDEYPGLFLTLAETPGTWEAILSFANRFGQLGLGVRGVGGEQVTDGAAAIHQEPEAENFGAWRNQISRLRKCVKAWDQAQRGESDEVAISEMEQTIANELEGRLRVKFAQDRQVGGFALQIAPVSLVGALWLQLAEAISGGKKHRACLDCGTWFEVTPEKNRESRLYCKEACRSRAYRARKEKAQALAAVGKTAKEIAKELDVDLKSVKVWLKQKP